MTKWKRGGNRQPMVDEADPGAGGEPVSGEQVLPHSLEAERAILGSVLTDNDLWSAVASNVDAAHFFRAPHRRLFDAMARLSMAGKPFDALILKDELARTRELDEVGGPVYIAELLDGATRATNVVYYAGIVREKALLRALIHAGKKTIAAAYEADQPSASIIDEGVRTLLGMAGSSTGSVLTLAEATKLYVDQLDQDRGVVIPTGFTDLDALILGFERKHLTLIAARPSVGKTSFISVAVDNIAARGEPAALISAEMEPEAIAGNLLAAHSGVSTARFRRKETLTEDNWQAIVQSVQQVQDRPFYIVKDVQTLTHVASWTRRLREQFGVRLVAIDYLQLLGDPQARDRQREVAAVSRGLKQIAKAEDVAVVALAMIGRDAEKRQDKRPSLSDLRESGALEADADLVVILYREEMHKPKDDNAGVGELIVAKNRTGPVGTVQATFVKETTRWADKAPIWRDA